MKKHRIIATEEDNDTQDLKCLDCTRHWKRIKDEKGKMHTRFVDRGDQKADHSGWMITDILATGLTPTIDAKVKDKND
jgi:hypothetical protein